MVELASQAVSVYAWIYALVLIISHFVNALCKQIFPLWKICLSITFISQEVLEICSTLCGSCVTKA